jgi:hypothetical protein
MLTQIQLNTFIEIWWRWDGHNNEDAILSQNEDARSDVDTLIADLPHEGAFMGTVDGDSVLDEEENRQPIQIFVTQTIEYSYSG